MQSGEDGDVHIPCCAPHRETFTIPLIPLGLKETKDVDFSVVLKDFILEHYSEDSYLYEDEVADLMDLRQVCFCVQQGREDRTAARACRVF